MFFWNSLAFLMIQWMLAIWSLAPLPFLKPAWTSGSSQFKYCWSLAWRILSITSMWDECNCVWTMNFQMFKLVLEKAEEPEIKLPTCIGWSKKQQSIRKTSTFALLTTPKPLTVWITTNCGKFLEIRIPDHLTCLLRNLYAGQEARVRTGHGTTD